MNKVVKREWSAFAFTSHIFHPLRLLNVRDNVASPQYCSIIDIFASVTDDIAVKENVLDNTFIVDFKEKFIDLGTAAQCVIYCIIHRKS